MNFTAGWLSAIFLLTAAQSALPSFLSVQGAKPDLMLILVGFAGIAAGRTHGMAAGFFCGLLTDLLNMGLFGFNVFLLFFAGLFAGTVQNKVFKDDILFPMILIAAFSAVKEAAWGLAVIIGGYRMTDPVAFFSLAAARVLYNGLITAPLFFLFHRVRRFVNR